MPITRTKPAARFVLSRLPQGAWLSPQDMAAALTRAGIDPDPAYINAVVRSLRRQGRLVTNADTNQVMRPARRAGV